MDQISINYTGTNEEGIVKQFINGSYILLYPCISSSICSPYEITLKPGVYYIECWGGSGYDVNIGSSLGGITSGSLSLFHKQTFYVYIGGKGGNNFPSSYNGGGKGTVNGYSGGGATDMRIVGGHFSDFESLISRVMVAGGGGGYPISFSDSQIRHFGDWCNSGGYIGGSGIVKHCSSSYQEISFSTGGSQTGGGIGSNCITTCVYGPKNDQADGKFGLGGNTSNNDHGGGGGGGYFGGGAGYLDGCIVSGGGGGSSYISGFDGCISVSPDSTINNVVPSSTSLHYSEYVFNNASMDIGSFGHGHFLISCTMAFSNPYLCLSYPSYFSNCFIFSMLIFMK